MIRMFVASSIAGLVIIPLIFSEVGYDRNQALLAVFLLEVCLYPTVRYFDRKEAGLPTMGIFCIAYALQFAVPFFVREPTIELIYGELRHLNDSDVTAALMMAIVGIIALQIGYYTFRRSQFRELFPRAALHLNKSKAVIFCALVGIMLPLLFNFRGIIPEEYQQPLSSILRLLQNQVLVVIGVLAWIAYGLKTSKWYRVWLYGLVIVTATRGISTGMLEEALIPIGVLFIGKWLYTQRIPVVPLLATIALVLFLSPVKSDYRERVWFGEDAQEQMSSASKASVWVEQASEYWTDVLSGNRALSEGTDSAASRTDFIHQIAHIFAMTPSVVPFQYGATYSYFAVAIIPRILWPDKPQAGSANNFYAVSYGISTEEGVKTSTFGVSILGEAFINFGWYGVVIVMLILGTIVSLLEHMFGGLQSGPGGRAVFVAFFVFFLNGIGSSTEIMFGGILQNLICGTALLWWARERPRASRTRNVRGFVGLPSRKVAS
jgi:fumarate reductase subunit C